MPITTEPERSRRIILDVDPGIDDAMAILLALHSPELQVEAITTVCGNVLVELAAENAVKVVELAGRPDVPVAKGAAGPLLKKPAIALVHGENGLGGVPLPAPRKSLDPRHAVDLMIDLVTANPGKITLVMVGPLTNLALALLKDRSLPKVVPEIILMGGAIGPGNVTPVAEFNIHSDAEAAKIVFESGIPITMVDLDATAQVMITRAHVAEMRRSPSPLVAAACGMLDYYISFDEKHPRPGAALHDPLAVGLAIDKSFATRLQPMHVAVETKGEYTYGQTVTNRKLRAIRRVDAGDHYVFKDFMDVEPNAEVPVVVDGERFLRMFMERLLAAGAKGQRRC